MPARAARCEACKSEANFELAWLIRSGQVSVLWDKSGAV